MFVCTGNRDRSPTAEALFRNTDGFEVKSAGVASNANTRITKESIQWADLIFVMEKWHKQELISIDKVAQDKIRVLNIPDIFHNGDSELKQLFETKMQPYLKRMKNENKKSPMSNLPEEQNNGTVRFADDV